MIFIFFKTYWLFLSLHMVYLETSLVAQTVKDLPAMQIESGRSLEPRNAIQCNILAWRIPRTEEPGGLQSMGSHSV